MVILLAIDTYFVEGAPELGEALVEPHVARFLTGYQIARPHVRQLVGHIFFAARVAVDDTRSESDVVGVFHTTFLGAHITDTVERIWPKYLFKITNNFLDMDKRARHTVHLVRLGIHLDGDITFNALVGVFPKLVLAHGKRDMVSGNLLGRLPMPAGGAIAVVDSLNEKAAADGFLVVGRGDKHVVGGFVGEVVDTREPGLAEVVRLTIEAYAKVIDIVRIIPFHAAPSLAESVAAIDDVQGG